MGLTERREARELDAIERRLVWIVGSPRTGTTWLLRMLGAHLEAVTLDEPQIGTHLVLFSPDLLGLPATGFADDTMVYNEWRRGQDDYFFSDRYAPVWQPALRRMMLLRFSAQAVDAGLSPRAPIIIKEPNGSQAAALIGRLLPQSRLLVVWRDGRDVVDSQLDASRKGAWMDVVGGGRDLSGQERLDYLTERALRWRTRTQVVQQAYADHAPDRRMALTYESLLAAPVPALEALSSWLGVPARTPAAAVAEAFDFAAIKPEDKGQGRFARAARPGMWRESLGPKEQQLLHEIMGATLEQLGYPDR